MSVRVTPKLRNQIVAAVEKSGRTLSQEIEFALECAFGNVDEAIANIKRARRKLAESDE